MSNKKARFPVILFNLDMMCDHYCVNECSIVCVFFKLTLIYFGHFSKCYNFQKLIPSK